MQFRCVRITSATTTSIFKGTCWVYGFYVTCANAGGGITLVIQDRAGTPRIWSPSFTLTVPTDGQPKRIPTLPDKALMFMEGGVDLVTGGTFSGTGIVSVQMAYELTQQGG